MSIAEKLTEIAESLPKVYDAGKKAQDKEFWDTYQMNGNRTDYQQAFSGVGWTEETFKPKHDIVLNGNGCYSMFLQSNINNSLSKILADNDVTITYNSAYLYNIFANSNFTEITFNKSGAKTFASTFYGCANLKTLILTGLSENDKWNNAFNNCSSLEKLTVEGIIGQNGFNVQWSTKLTRDSLISIINALSLDTSGLTITFSTVAVNSAFGIDVNDESTFPEGSEYYTLRNSKLNWNFSYA